MSSSKIIGCGMLFIMCLISASIAQDEIEDEIEDMQPPNDQEELLENVQELLGGIQSMLDPDNETISENANLAWKCSGARCQRCQRIRIKKIKFNEYCCLYIVYLKSSRRFRTTLKCASVKFSREISLSNPKRFCTRVPAVFGRLASICVKLSNLTKHRKCAHGCASVYGRWLFVKVATVNLGCFDMYFRDQAEAEPESALEPPSYDTSDWIGNEQDTAAMPDFDDDDMVMMENIGQPL